MKKKLISLLMALCMVVTMLPTAAIAAEGSIPIGPSDVTDGGTPAPKCSCTVQCAAADAENKIEAVINPDCPVCGAEGADLAHCKGEAPALLVAPRAGDAVELTSGDVVTTYASIGEAFAAERKDKDVVKLLKDVTLTSDLGVSVESKGGYKVVLNLNGKTLDCGSFKIIVNKNTLGIVDNAAVAGKVSGTNAEEVILVTPKGDLLLNDNVTVKNTGSGSAIRSELGSDIMVNAATVTAEKNYAIQNHGAVSVMNGVITSGSKEAILSVGTDPGNEKSGFVMISGGSVKGVDHRNGKPVVRWVGGKAVEIQPYVFTIPGEVKQPITSLETEPATDGYGTGGVAPDSNGAIYAWLEPNRTKVIIKIGEKTYSAAIDPTTGGAELEKEETPPPSGDDDGSSSSPTVTPPASSSNVESKGDGKVMVRIYMNTANAQSFKENILLGGTVSGKAVDYTKNKFVNFDNKMAIVSLAQQKPFAVSAEIAAKVDLTGLDTKTLFFYSYDRATNKYYPISAPSYRMDKSGYLHFNTTRAGDIVITDKPLTLKK